MRVRAVKSFGSTFYGHKPAGSVFELPDGVDWLEAGLVEPVDEKAGEIESATLEAPEKAVKPRAKKKTTRTTRRKSTAKK